MGATIGAYSSACNSNSFYYDREENARARVNGSINQSSWNGGHGHVARIRSNVDLYKPLIAFDQPVEGDL